MYIGPVDPNGTAYKVLFDAIVVSPFLPFIQPKLSLGQWSVISNRHDSATARQVAGVDSCTGWLLGELCTHITSVMRGVVLLGDEIVNMKDPCMSRVNRPQVWVHRGNVFWPIMRFNDSTYIPDVEDVYSWRGGFRTVCFFTEAHSDSFARGDQELSDEHIAFLGDRIKRIIVDYSHESFIEVLFP